MIKFKSPLTKSNLLILCLVYIISIVFFFRIAPEQNMETFLGSVKIATIIILIPSFIGWYILKWMLEVIFTILQINKKDSSYD